MSKYRLLEIFNEYKIGKLQEATIFINYLGEIRYIFNKKGYNIEDHNGYDKYIIKRSYKSLYKRIEFWEIEIRNEKFNQLLNNV